MRAQSNKKALCYWIFAAKKVCVFTITASGIEGNVDIRVLNAQGQLISSTQLVDGFAISLDLTSYPKGVYFVKASAAEESFTQKVIVK